jgi:hypothetical protein
MESKKKSMNRSASRQSFSEFQPAFLLNRRVKLNLSPGLQKLSNNLETDESLLQQYRSENRG